MSLLKAIQLFTDEGTPEFQKYGALVWRRASIATLIITGVLKMLENIGYQGDLPLPGGSSTRDLRVYQQGIAEGFDRMSYLTVPGVREALWENIQRQPDEENGEDILHWLGTFAMLCVAEDLAWTKEGDVITRPVLEPVYRTIKSTDSSGRTTAQRYRMI